jgi:hypothetical protein
MFSLNPNPEINSKITPRNKELEGRRRRRRRVNTFYLPEVAFGSSVKSMASYYLQTARR